MPQRLDVLIRNTPYKTFAESKSVKITHFDPRTGIKRLNKAGEKGWSIEWKTSGEQRTHRCQVKLLSDEIERKVPAWVWCDCGDFTYRLEYALAQKNSSSIVKAEPAPPEETNPKLQTRLCKHLLKIIQLLPETKLYLKRNIKVTFGG